SASEKMNSIEPQRSLAKKSAEPRGDGRLSDSIAAVVIKSAALLAIASLVLIFIFIAKEAVPIFTSAEIQKEATLGKMFLPQPEPEAIGNQSRFVWQPVSEPAKISIIPLLIGTLKSTLIAIAFA